MSRPYFYLFLTTIYDALPILATVHNLLDRKKLLCLWVLWGKTEANIASHLKDKRDQVTCCPSDLADKEDTCTVET